MKKFIFCIVTIALSLQFLSAPYEDEVRNFKQICPKEMLDKLTNPLSLKKKISRVV